MPSLDIYAEQGLLAGMINDPTVINEVVKIVSTQDFLEPRHENIFDAIISLQDSGKHIDFVTVAAELRERGDFIKVGGVDYLSGLLDPSAPYAADADPVSYAIIVADESRRRSLKNIGQEIVRLSQPDNGTSIDEAIAQGENMVRRLLESSTTTETSSVKDLIDDAISRLEFRASVPGGVVQGVPSGFIDLDEVTSGFHPGNFVVLAARPAIGKALHLETVIPSPEGNKTMRELKVGDLVYAWDRTITHVTNITPIMENRECYEIKYDGQSIIADAEHEFPVIVYKNGKNNIKRVIITVSQMVTILEQGYGIALVQTSEPQRQEEYTHDDSASEEEGTLVLSGQLGYKVITNITKVPSVPVKCIEVAHKDHLYLCNDYIVTHNSTLALDFARAAAIKADKTVLMFSLEMSKDELMDRLISAEANVGLKNIRKGTLSESEWSSIRETLDRIKDHKLIFDPTPNATLEYIRAVSTQQLASEKGLDLVIIDYLQLMNSSKKVENRQQEVSEFSRKLKLLAKELGIPIIALSQLNRGSENRSDKTPQMSDLRESGSIEQDADIVLLLHRPESESANNNDKTLLIVAKNRNGPTKVVFLAPLLAYSKFANGTGLYPLSSVPPDDEDFIPPAEDDDTEAYREPTDNDDINANEAAW